MVGVKFDEKNKLWSHIGELECYDENISFGQMLLNTLSDHGTKTAQINHDTGAMMSFNELRLKTICAAQNLRERGFQYKDVFSFMAVNSENLCPIVFAALCMGCPINPLHFTLSKEEIAKILKKTKTKGIFCDIDSYNLIDEALKEIKSNHCELSNVQIFTFDGQTSNSEPVDSLFIQRANEHEFIPVNVDLSNDIAGIFSSSGTTGPSKCMKFTVDSPNNFYFDFHNYKSVLSYSSSR